ncbi:lantibiotic dehydratase [Pedobacter cryoconitis]|uniref:Thiopeptide-type bacteriocin biosynthesis protein n=1 Tax=Pedobacter cryoconitis TaxID=188932 RepID=A0A7X0J626_9SPHI|nr:lantibiotic dehydratase [Pedobacter cryoconitis]MBB6501563.1 thiopeptide-type bacteriocin biosynthesis protein [Pedobacter cryoconitis]
MSALTIDPFLFVRSPAYSYTDFNEAFLRQVLPTDFFQASLFLASRPLYIELKKKEFDYDHLNESAKATLWKYLNRMCFRPLPYGLFASFSMGVWGTGEEDTFRMAGGGKLTILPDFMDVLNYVNALETKDLSFINYYPNNSLYSSAAQLYFISQSYSAQDNFSIVHLKVVPGLKKLLKFISKGQTRSAILDYLKNEYGEDEALEDYFEGLVKGQVIVSALKPNVTGLSYNQRCIGLLGQQPGHNLSKLQTHAIDINDQSQPSPVLNSCIAHFVTENVDNLYSLYQREISGGLRSTIQAELISVVENMDKLTAHLDFEVMSAFKAAFTQKYELQEVSLMEALDPGFGVGYQNLASAFDNQHDEFINDWATRKEEKISVRWGQVEKMLFKKWNAMTASGSDRIMLTAEDIEALPESKHRLPPGLSVLFKCVDDELWIDNVGGVSGVQLCSRFGLTDQAVEDQLKRICEQEMAMNKDFVFAEIAFSPSAKASNINQRGHFYAYEIPVLTHATRPDKEIIKLNDLMISVQDNQILLRSVRLNKYIIPRLSSAYNYELTTVPVFRFLCDLQYQGVKSNLSFSMASIFPGMDYYPCVQIGKAILSPATWILNESQLKQIAKLDSVLDEVVKLPVTFSLVQGDNFLVFNRNNEKDLQMFRRCIRNKKTVTLREYTSSENTGLRDVGKRPYTSQFLACVINQSASYPMVKPSGNLKKTPGIKRTFLPGEEWLYVKLYTHDSLTDRILIDYILPVIRQYKKNNPGFKWFFIRYQDPGHHLRLRFFSAERSPLELMAELNEKLKPMYNSGKTYMTLDTYQRELEKYSPGLIDKVESVFYRDSEYITDSFRKGSLMDTRFKLNFAVSSTLLFISCFIKDGQKRLEFLNDSLNNLSGEFDKGKETIRKMDTKYRSFQPELIRNEQLSDWQQNKTWLLLKQMLIEIDQEIIGWEYSVKYDFIINLIHMHINRIFESHSREYEYLTYHFMRKHQTYYNYTINAVS